MKRRSQFKQNREYSSLPVNLTAEVTQGWAAQLRLGNQGIKEKIIEGHIRLVIDLARCFARGFRLDDAEGVALLALVDAVDRAETALTDDNITPYITAVVKSQLREFVASDRIVYMPRRSFDHAVKNGTINAEGNNSPTIAGVMSNAVSLDEADPEGEGNIDTFIARTDEPSLEFKEALTYATRGNGDHAADIINMRQEGHKYTTIAEKLGIKKSRVGAIVQSVETRFAQLYA